jgi:hypothetical protein
MTEKKMFSSKYGLLIGITLSAIYTVIAVGFLWLNLNSKAALELNEVGDYLAGAFSPLAFLWLVVGYFMQSKELNFTREELKLTRLAYEANLDEVKKSVQLTKDAFDFNKKIQIRNYKESHEINQPKVIKARLSYHSSKHDPEYVNIEDFYQINLYFYNQGKEAKNVSIVSELQKVCLIKQTEIKEGDNNFLLDYLDMKNTLHDNNFIITNEDQLLDTIRFSYFDAINREQKFKFEIYCKYIVNRGPALTLKLIPSYEEAINNVD